MARFSQAFLQGLLQPTYQQGLFEAAKGLGQTPGIMRMEKERKEKEAKELAQIDQLMTTSGQATAAAQQGDVSAVTRQINDLRQQMVLATTLDQKKMYAQEIRNLQKLIPETQKVSISNKAQSILRAEEAVLDPTLDPRAKEALEQRIVEMKKDPQAMAEYNKYKLDQWRTDKAQQQMEADAWIKDNSTAITQAIKEEDFDELDNIISGAGEFSSAAQTFASTIIASEKTMQQFEENSMLNKMAPDTSVEEEQISSLPEELQKMVKPSMLKYKKLVEEGWDEDTKTWKTGYRVRAEAAQKEVQGLYRNIINQIATSEYFADIRATRDNEQAIKELELQLEAPIDIREIRLLAKEFQKNPKKPLTQADLDAAEKYLRDQRDRGIIRQIEMLRSGTEEEEQGSVSELDGYKASDYEGEEVRDESTGTIYKAIRGKWVPQLEEVKVSARSRSTTYKKPTNIYSESFVTKGAESVGRFMEGVGEFVEERGQRARDKLKANPYEGTS